MMPESGTRPAVELVSYNVSNVELCASAARISTTKGDACEIFEKAAGNEKNEELIRRVLRSGHASIAEHAVFSFAFRNVSAFAEQFFIESRLASFTVKSRRYVDFSGAGYYIPPELKGGDLDCYCRYMDHLFAGYGMLLENGVPREDARFLLPYSFHSNFYCTVNARQLCHILRQIRRGRGRDIPELRDLAAQMEEKAGRVFPCLREMAEILADGTAAAPPPRHPVRAGSAPEYLAPEDLGMVELLNAPSDPLRVLGTARELGGTGDGFPADPDLFLRSERPRELEQLTYSFRISDVTLSGITHMTRHRMQSLMVPPIEGIAHSRFVVPDTVRRDGRLLERYREVLETAVGMQEQMSANPVLRRYHYYYALSGNVMDILTTQNARELLHFIRLRTCNRAQWEIRDIAESMLRLLRGSCPELFGHYGPGCFVDGACPEGRMTCGKMREVTERFARRTF